MSNNKQRGFTLVEIVIVLVIVGLLIGAVLKSREMVTNANIKRIESDKSDLTTAVLAYQDRYKALPGDDRDATIRFEVYSGVATANGNGDGEIGDGDDWNRVVAFPWADDISHETSKAFAHLRAAGLIGGSPQSSDRPYNAYGGPIGIQDGALQIGEHTIVFGAIDGAAAKIL
jgi:prepilin-type N-terminal cleavage/methylation domain-containing protein